MALRLKNRWQSPIGGFMFTQPETGATFQDWGFNAIVVQVVNHRGNNPRFNLSTDPNAVGAEVDLQNATRMLSTPGGREFIADDGGGGAPNFPVPRPQKSGSVAGTSLGRLGSGIGAWADWFGEGAQPVEPALASARAAVCAKCPKNETGPFSKWFTIPAANMLLQRVEAFKGLKLTTPSDDALNVCVACSCPLKPAVHFPLAVKLRHMNAETMSKLDPGCWILIEQAAQK